MAISIQQDVRFTGIELIPSGEYVSPDHSRIGIDQIFEILKNQRRRWVLRYVEAADGPVILRDLAETIAAYENEKDRSQITSRERKRVYVGLYQVHLPKMDDMDIISFNKPRGIIEPGPNFDLVREYLPDEDMQPAEPGLRRHLYVASISTLLVAVFGVIELLTPMQLLQPISVLVVGAIALVSVLHFTRGPLEHIRRRWDSEPTPESQEAGRVI